MGAQSQGPLLPQLMGFVKSVIHTATGTNSSPVSIM